MKVLYDHQTFTWQRYGGISRYFAELINYFKETKAADYELSLICSDNYYLRNYGIFRPGYTARRIEHISNKRIQYSINKANSRIALYTGSYDLFHPTYYDPYFLKYIKDKPYVLTVYDMIHEIYPELFEKPNKIAEYKKALACRAKKIISISENTKNDILRFYDIDDEKIEVIPLGCSINKNDKANSPDNLTRPDNMNSSLPERFILFVGNRQSYKNFLMLIESIAPILRKDDGLFLVCVGGDSFSDSEIACFNNLAIRHKLIYLPVSDSNLACLYQKALAFVFPSLYEGFGLPILESFSCGCPVLLSDSSSFPEVAKDAAVYFDPRNKTSIEEAVIKVIYNERSRNILKLRGYEVLKNFSWEKTAKKTLSLYKSIL